MPRGMQRAVVVSRSLNWHLQLDWNEWIRDRFGNGGRCGNGSTCWFAALPAYLSAFRQDGGGTLELCVVPVVLRGPLGPCCA
jgi:hypothetical protein